MLASRLYLQSLHLFHIPGICPKIPSFSIFSAIYSETSSFFKFCLYAPKC
nr:MAG TPA: hypothetical protein [Caudoviricetes sp.]